MAKSVLIIGGGVIGLASAYYASRKGFLVTVVDSSRVDDQGCSHGNAGMVVPSHFIPLAAPGALWQAFKWMWNPESPLYVEPSLSPELLKWGWRFWRASTADRVERASLVLRDLHLASRAAFTELARHPAMDFGLVEKGLFMLCHTQAALDHEAKTAELANRLGVPARVLDARQTAALDPGVEMDIVGSVHFPKDCHLSPHRFMESLRRHLVEAGVTFHWQTRVEGFRLEMDRFRSVHTDHGELQTDEVVVCGGAWSTPLGRQLGLRLPLQAGKGYSLTLPQPRQLPQVCSLLTEARVAVTPLEGALRVGGTMEIAGLSEAINARRVEGILKALPRYYPAFKVEDFAGITPWVGLRPVSPDGLPYLGRTRRWSNVVVATGHAMMGLSLAPVTGQIVAALLAGETPGFDLSLLSPERFGADRSVE